MVVVIDGLYVYVHSGVYDILVGSKKVGSYDNKGSFGELALMYNMPRAATIIATTTGTLWAMVCCSICSSICCSCCCCCGSGSSVSSYMVSDFDFFSLYIFAYILSNLLTSL